MGFVDKLKAGAEQTAIKARETAQDLQTKKELSTAYSDLGKAAFKLADAGELSHGELSAGVDHIKELQARLAGDSGTSEDE